MPLGTYGVFVSGSLQPAEFDAFDRELTSILGAETEAALEAVECERTPRERESDIARENERLEEFPSVVSHDFRNLLNIATGRLALAEEECDSAFRRPSATRGVISVSETPASTPVAITLHHSMSTRS